MSENYRKKGTSQQERRQANQSVDQAQGRVRRGDDGEEVLTYLCPGCGREQLLTMPHTCEHCGRVFGTLIKVAPEGQGHESRHGDQAMTSKEQVVDVAVAVAANAFIDLRVAEGLLPSERCKRRKNKCWRTSKCALLEHHKELLEHHSELLRENLRSQGERTCRYWLLRYRGDDLETVEAETRKEAVEQVIDCIEVDAEGNMLDDGDENEEEER